MAAAKLLHSAGHLFHLGLVGGLHVLQLLLKVQPLLHQFAGQLHHPAVLHPQPLHSKNSFLQVKAKLRREGKRKEWSLARGGSSHIQEREAGEVVREGRGLVHGVVSLLVSSSCSCLIFLLWNSRLSLACYTSRLELIFHSHSPHRDIL